MPRTPSIEENMSSGEERLNVIAETSREVASSGMTTRSKSANLLNADVARGKTLNNLSHGKERNEEKKQEKEKKIKKWTKINRQFRQNSKQFKKESDSNSYKNHVLGIGGCYTEGKFKESKKLTTFKNLSKGDL